MFTFKSFALKKAGKKGSGFGEIKFFSLPYLHIVVIKQKKLRHFLLAMKSFKKIIYLDSRDNLGPVCKNPALSHFFFFWTTSRGLFLFFWTTSWGLFLRLSGYRKEIWGLVMELNFRFLIGREESLDEIYITNKVCSI